MFLNMMLQSEKLNFSEEPEQYWWPVRQHTLVHQRMPLFGGDLIGSNQEELEACVACSHLNLITTLEICCSDRCRAYAQSQSIICIGFCRLVWAFSERVCVRQKNVEHNQLDMLYQRLAMGQQVVNNIVSFRRTANPATGLLDRARVQRQLERTQVGDSCATTVLYVQLVD